MSIVHSFKEKMDNREYYRLETTMIIRLKDIPKGEWIIFIHNIDG